MSGLRRKCGIPWEKLRHLCGEDFKRISELIIKQLEQIESFRAGLINWGLIDSKIGLTVPNGFLFADEITARLIQTLKVKHFDIIYKNK